MEEKSEVNEIIKEFLDKRPNCTVAIGYGSGVIKQNGYQSIKGNQIDLLVGVDNTHLWHQENMLKNPSDYSNFGLKYFQLPSKMLDFYTGINFLPYLEHNDCQIKLGVFDVAKTRWDLLLGKSLYLAGRLSKPNLVIKSTDEFNEVIENTRKMALWVGACMLGRKGMVRNLYINIAGFSYLGDVRNGIKIFGREFCRKENPKKIVNLVDGSFSEYDEIYRKIEAPFIDFGEEMVDVDLLTLIEVAKDYLPSSLYVYLYSELQENEFDKVRELLIEYFSSKNCFSSIVQALKGFVTTDFVKTKKYLSEKSKKAKL